MTLTLNRAALVLLAASAAVIGGWASFAPHSFYSSFPVPGHAWVADDPPFNEHLVRDVGGLYLALLVATLWCLARADRGTAAVTGLAWEAFSVPHLVFHAGHTGGMGSADAVAELAALGLTVVLAAVPIATALTRRGTRTAGAVS